MRDTDRQPKYSEAPIIVLDNLSGKCRIGRFGSTVRIQKESRLGMNERQISQPRPDICVRFTATPNRTLAPRNSPHLAPLIRPHGDAVGNGVPDQRRGRPHPEAPR